MPHRMEEAEVRAQRLGRTGRFLGAEGIASVGFEQCRAAGGDLIGRLLDQRRPPLQRRELTPGREAIWREERSEDPEGSRHRFRLGALDGGAQLVVLGVDRLQRGRCATPSPLGNDTAIGGYLNYAPGR